MYVFRFACLWGFIGCSDGDNEDSWVYRSGETRPVILYTISLYYSIMTLTTVGYGDVTPGTLSEYVTATLIMFAGGFIWAYVIGGIALSPPPFSPPAFLARALSDSRSRSFAFYISLH